VPEKSLRLSSSICAALNYIGTAFMLVPEKSNVRTDGVMGGTIHPTNTYTYQSPSILLHQNNLVVNGSHTQCHVHVAVLDFVPNFVESIIGLRIWQYSSTGYLKCTMDPTHCSAVYKLSFFFVSCSHCFLDYRKRKQTETEHDAPTS
jgi:hypothetical protein